MNYVEFDEIKWLYASTKYTTETLVTKPQSTSVIMGVGGGGGGGVPRYLLEFSWMIILQYSIQALCNI